MNRRHLRLATSLALVLMLTGAVENNSYAQENVFNNAIKVAIETKPVEVKDEDRSVKYVSRGVPREAKNSGSFKSYMDFRCITDKSSKQYKFQKECMTDQNGLRKWNYEDQDYYVVALGSTYSETIGTRFKVTLNDDGEEHSIYIVLGDCKKDIHTDDTNRFIEKNGNIIEFIVSQRDLPPLAKKMGDVSYADDNLMGKIVKIEEIKEY